MNDTIKYYDKHAQTYYTNTINADMSLHYQHFLKYLKEGASILDAGCGSGRDSKYFLSQGYKVSAFDGSCEMASLASAYLGIDVRTLKYEELDYDNEFDGIWSCASLLHVPKESFENVVNRLHKALKKDGILYVSMKYGESERIDSSNRYFNDITEDDISLFTNAGFTLLETYRTVDVRKGREDKWINIVLKKEVFI